jgi:DNA mismatch repair ATPase MutS
VTRERDWERLRDYARVTIERDQSYEVDARTWADLALDEVFVSADRTLTAPGEQALWAALRRPALSEGALTARLRLVECLGRAPEACQVVRAALGRLGRRDGAPLTDLLWREDVRPPYRLGPYRAGLLGVIASGALAAFVSPLLGMLGLVIMIMVNVYLHNRARMSNQHDLQAARYLWRLLGQAEALGQSPQTPSPQREMLAEVARDSRRLRRRLAVERFLSNNVVDELVGTFNVLLLSEARAYARAHAEIVRLRPQLRRAFIALAELDVAQSILAWRDEHPGWARPVFAADSALVVSDLVHPLLARPVPNSFERRGGGLVVTGSNMSGKSTFLRSLGVAGVLAQSLGTAPAAGYRSGWFRVCSVMGASDDLNSGTSYYLDEARAVKRAIDSATAAPGALVILDELFRGTNSNERIAAGVAVVRWLADHGGLVLLATHDLDVAALLADRLSSAHFQEEVGGDGVTFDYRLLPGPAVRSNALDVLAHVGYPAGIVSEARALAAAAPAPTRAPPSRREAAQ